MALRIQEWGQPAIGRELLPAPRASWNPEPGVAPRSVSPASVASRAQAPEDLHSQETWPTEGHPEDTPQRDNREALRAVGPHPGLSSTPTSPSENTHILALCLKMCVKKLQEVVDTGLDALVTALLSLSSPRTPAANAGAVQGSGGTR